MYTCIMFWYYLHVVS